VRLQKKIDRLRVQGVRYREEDVCSKDIDLADVEADDLVVKRNYEVDVWQGDNDDY